MRTITGYVKNCKCKLTVIIIRDGTDDTGSRGRIDVELHVLVMTKMQFLHKYVSIVIRYPLNTGGQGAACLLKLKTDGVICIRSNENVVRYIYSLYTYVGEFFR
jgi:hypothetical protein